jgi:hypothetical protein
MYLRQINLTEVDIEVFWVVIPCSDVAGYQRFGEPCCLLLGGEVTGDGKEKAYI